nr:MAG TPA: hypothetical protein [Caudoviricetes sp.]
MAYNFNKIPINPGAMNGIFNCLILQIRLPFLYTYYI